MGPQGLEKGDYNYTYGIPRPTGNPMLDMGMYGLYGFNQSARPYGRQSPYDAYVQQQRARMYMMMQRDNMTNNHITRFMGINPNNYFVKQAGSMIDPNSQIAQTMSMMMGGNPAIAQMQLYAGMTGTTTGAFGRTTDMSARETGLVTKSMMDQFYNTKVFSKEDEIERINKEVRAKLKKDKKLFDKVKKQGKLDDPDKYDVRTFKNEKELDSDEFRARSEMLREEADSIWRTKDEDKNADREKMREEKKDAINKKARSFREDLVKKGISEERLKKYTTRKRGWGSFAVDPFGLFAQGNVDEFDHEAFMNDYQKGGTLFDDATDQYGYAIRNDGTRVAKDINYKKSRGFNLEDFTGGFYQAADSQLIGGRGKTPAQKAAAFQNNSGRALDAARSVFGDKSGKELVKDISDIMGSDTVDLSSEQGAKEVEDLLTNMKAATKLAGTSIDYVLAIVKEAQQLAKSKPSLKNLSGMVTAQITTQALGEVKALNATMSADQIRKEGGTQGMLAKRVDEKIRLLDEAPSKQIASLSFMFKDNEEVQKLLENYSQGKDEKGNAIEVNEQTRAELVSKVSKISGKGLDEIYMGMANEHVQAEAMGDKAFAERGGRLAERTVLDKMEVLTGGQGNEIMKQIQDEYAKDKGKDADKQEGFDKITTRILGMKSPQALELYKDYQQTARRAILREIDPEFKRIDDEQQTQMAKVAEDDKKMSEKLAHLRAPVVQRAAQKFFSGEVTSENLDRMFDIFKEDPTYEGGDNEEVLKEKKEAYKDFYKGQEEAEKDKNYGSREKKLGDNAVGFLNKVGIKGASNEKLQRLNALVKASGGKNGSVKDLRERLKDDKNKDLAQLAKDMGVTETQESYDSMRKGGITSTAETVYKNQLQKRIDQALAPDTQEASDLIEKGIGSIKDKGLEDAVKKAYTVDGKTDWKSYAMDSQEDRNDKIKSAYGKDLTEDQKAKIETSTTAGTEKFENIKTKSQVQMEAATGQGYTDKEVPALLGKMLEKMPTNDVLANLSKSCSDLATTIRG